MRHDLVYVGCVVVYVGEIHFMVSYLSCSKLWVPSAPSLSSCHQTFGICYVLTFFLLTVIYVRNRIFIDPQNQCEAAENNTAQGFSQPWAESFSS